MEFRFFGTAFPGKILKIVFINAVFFRLPMKKSGLI